jgi:HPr kinase/phosphorylase
MNQKTTSGVMVCVHGKGILIIGPSGIGKSELALALIDRGHQLVADDALTVEKVENTLLASAPDVLSGRLNIREFGIINVEQHFGITSLCKKHRVDLIIDMLPHEPKQSLNPLPLEYATQNLLGIEVPYLQLTAGPTRHLALLVEVAAKQAIQRERGFNVNHAFVAQAIEKMGQPS